MGEDERSKDFLLGKLEAMAEMSQRNHELELLAIKDVRNAFTEHAKADSDQFREIQTTIADAKGRVKGGVWVMSIVMTLASLLIGFFGSVVSKAMGW